MHICMILKTSQTSFSSSYLHPYCPFPLEVHSKWLVKPHAPDPVPLDSSGISIPLVMVWALRLYRFEIHDPAQICLAVGWLEEGRSYRPMVEEITVLVVVVVSMDMVAIDALVESAFDPCSNLDFFGAPL